MKLFAMGLLLFSTTMASATPLCAVNNNRGREITKKVCYELDQDNKIVLSLETQNGPVILKEVAVKKLEHHNGMISGRYEFAQIDLQGNIMGRARYTVDVSTENGIPFMINNSVDRHKKLIGAFWVGMSGQ